MFSVLSQYIKRILFTLFSMISSNKNTQTDFSKSIICLLWQSSTKFSEISYRPSDSVVFGEEEEWLSIKSLSIPESNIDKFK